LRKNRQRVRRKDPLLRSGFFYAKKNPCFAKNLILKWALLGYRIPVSIRERNLMKGKGIKKRLIRMMSFVLSFICSFGLIGGCGGGICLAIADIPKGTASGTTYKVDDVITNWNQLEGLLADYKTINLSKARIRDYNFSHFTHLGDESGTEFIAKIDCSNPAELYPQMILPAYDAATGSFQATHPVNSTSNPVVIIAYQWLNNMSYVYDDTRDNKITVNHEIRDENGQILLPYATMVEKIDEVDVVNNTLTIKNINSPERSGDAMKVVYSAVLNGYTSYRGALRTRFTSSMGYYYKLNTEFNSAIKTDVDIHVLGGVNILAQDEAGEAVSGAKFKLYSDAECSEEAERFNGNEWVEIGTLESGADGGVRATNLMPGTYYVKEIEAASNYEMSDAAVEVLVPNKDINLGIDADSGEGSSIEIYKEEVVLEPEWEMDSMDDDTPFKQNADNVETVSAASYNGGGETFIRAGGSAAAYESTDDVSELEGMSKLNGEKYEVAVGSVCESFDNPSAALAYVNNSLIADGVLDDESAQDHVTIGGDNLLYYDEASCVQANFVETEIVDVPPTGIEASLFAIPLMLLALIGCCCLVLI